MADELIQVPPEDLLSTIFHPIEAMIDEVAGLVGGSDDPGTRQKAIRALDRAADWVNMSGVLMYRRTEQTYDSLTSNQTTLERPADWGWPDMGARAYNAAGDLISTLEWLDWDTFQGLISGTANRDSIPKYLSMRSDFEGNIFLFPFVDPTLVDRIEIPYIRRIERLSETNEVLATPETREALIVGGEAFVMRHRYARSPNVWMPFWRHFTNAITLAKGAADRYRQVVFTGARPDEDGRIGPSASTWPGRVIFVV